MLKNVQLLIVIVMTTACFEDAAPVKGCYAVPSINHPTPQYVVDNCNNISPGEIVEIAVIPDEYWAFDDLDELASDHSKDYILYIRERSVLVITPFYDEYIIILRKNYEHLTEHAVRQIVEHAQTGRWVHGINKSGLPES
jgi:hypothetical protein